MNVLVVNAGSSSLKLRLLGSDAELVASRDLTSDDDLTPAMIDELASESGASVGAVGHRFVHGGPDFIRPTVIDDAVRDRLEALTDLAPLHVPAALAGVDAAITALPDVPAVACFDTAFHADLPAAAATYAVPARWRRQWAVRRYGFHGLSYAYAWQRARELSGRDGPGLRAVLCHLGAGASVCAVRDGTSVDTSMGFTPLEGLVMATRSGTVDPGLVLWLIERQGLPAREVEEALEQYSGLLALAGTPDLRTVVERAGNDADAQLALDVYTHRLRAGIAAMTAALGGLELLVFTGGVGEHSPVVRAAATDQLHHLGIALDPQRNMAASADADISAPGSAVTTLVITAREDVQISREVRRALTRPRKSPTLPTAPPPR